MCSRSHVWSQTGVGLKSPNQFPYYYDHVECYQGYCICHMSGRIMQQSGRHAPLINVRTALIRLMSRPFTPMSCPDWSYGCAYDCAYAAC